MTKKLKCRIQVTAGVKREVSTQAQLNAALKKKDTEQITINNTTQETSYQIPAGTYSHVALIVKAGSAKVTNNGIFRSVTIQSAKRGGNWTENVKGNSLQVTSTVSKIVVNKGAKVSNLTLEKAGADTRLEIRGRVSKVNVNGANTKLAISGSTASVVPITVNKAAPGAKVIASVRVMVAVKAKKVRITLNKGSEDSTIKAIQFRTGVVNNSDGNVMVTDGNGTVSLMPGGEITTVVLTGTSGNNGNASSTEEKNKEELKILRNIIKEQRTRWGSIIPENFGDNSGIWENGHLVSLNWGYIGLKGKLRISGLTHLKSIDCHGNRLTSLDVSGLTSLEELDCGDNYQMKSLNVSGLTSLENLSCGANQLTNLDVSGLTSLKVLSCGPNKLTDLNVSGLVCLEDLFCSSNQLTDLNVSGLTSLYHLECANNRLKDLDVSDLTSLIKLECSSNQLTSLDLSNLPLLWDLNCDDNVTVIGRLTPATSNTQN